MYALPNCLILMGGPAVSAAPAPYSHQWFVGNGVQLAWGNNPTLTGFTIATPGAQSSPAYTGPGGEDFLIEGVVSSGLVGECFGVHAQYWNVPTLPISQRTRHIVVRHFYDSRGTLTTGGSGFAVIGSVFGMLIEDVEINLGTATGGTGLSNCFIAGYQGAVNNVTIRRCLFVSNPDNHGGAYPNQVLELQGNGLAGTTTGGIGDIRIEDTTFNSGATSGFAASGSGGAYIDDNDGRSGIGFVNRVAFKNCVWIFCGMTLQTAASPGTPGYITFEGSMPGEFYPNPGPAYLAGRPVLAAPNLSANGLYPASAAQVALATGSGTQMAAYSPVSGLVGIFRVLVNVAAVASATATVVVSWHDPNAGNQSLTLISTGMSGNTVISASLTVVADSGGITVTGSSSLSAALFGSAAITQVG